MTMDRAPSGLFESSELLKALFKALPLGICITDDLGHFVYTNKAYNDIYGYEPSELLGKSFLLVVLPEQKAELQDMHDDFIDNDLDELPASWNVVRKDGQRIHINATAGRFVGKDGRRYKVTTVLDVTEKIRLERMREDAERVVRHDLRSPLTGMLAGMELLLDSPLNEDQQKCVEYCQLAGKRMLHLLNHSMDLFRLEEGSYELAPHPMDLAALMLDMRAEFQSFIDGRGKRLECFVGDRPCALNTPCPLLAERELIECLFANLIRNALEASPDNSVVTARIEPESESWVVSIRNRGVVAENIRPRLFSRYATNKPLGTGLGAYSARLIARAHGGDVSFETSEEEGVTTFRVILPREPKPSIHTDSR